jgi:4-amino-4-deoxy-L-arabinose transferase-like glycosyltransferase
MHNSPSLQHWPLAAILTIAIILHWFASPWGEPFKNNDETRHVMTGVFVHDALRDLPASATDPKGYSIRYYTQYPALGLLVWPPLFYGIEGLAMLVLGPTYATARLVLSAFVILGMWYVYRFVGDRFGTRIALLATSLTLLSPLLFDLSRFCLLEMPTFAWVMASIYHFERYLYGRKGYDAWLACLFAAAASLTRFDGVMLLVFFGMRIMATNSWARLLDRHVIAGMLLALLLTAPYYAFTWKEYQTGLQAAAMNGTMKESRGFLAIQNLYLYLGFLDHMLGRTIIVVALYGMYRCWRNVVTHSGVCFTLILATYVMFVPLAEAEERHAIYWVPAWCTFAALGIRFLFEHGNRVMGGLALLLVIGNTAWDAFAYRGNYFQGYADAAQFCKETKQTDRPWLCDGTLTGGFIFQVRQIDPERRLTVLRGDKLLYAVLSDPNAGYAEFAKGDDEILELLHDYDPEFIVVENPHLLDELPVSQRLRLLLAKHSEHYRLEKAIAIRTNHYLYAGKELQVWRKLQRNPKAKSVERLPVLGLGRSIGNNSP